MRLAVLDIGSNTGHLLVVDAHRGAAPTPAFSHKRPLRLAEHLDASGAVTEHGVLALTGFVAEALVVAEDKGCAETLGFATSAVRDASNSEEVLAHVAAQTGVSIEVLPGADEARLTFLAVRRWFGWSAGRLGVFDIGGGSLEIAAGGDEEPDVAWSMPLGAARLTREHLAVGPDEVLDPGTVQTLRRAIRSEVAEDAGKLLRNGHPDRAVATSKSFRTLARICGAAPSSEGIFVPRVLTAEEMAAWVPKLAAMTAQQVTELPGVSASRAHQVLAAALVADACLDIFDLPEMEICPWALREGVILERFDQIRDAGPEPAR